MAAPLALSPRQSAHKRAADRAAAVELLEEKYSSGTDDQLHGKSAAQRVVDSNSGSSAASAQQKRSNSYDVALLQSAIESRELKNRITDLNDELASARGQISNLTRENEKSKRELLILANGNNAASRDATLLAEVQMQLVEANAKNDENAQLIQALEQAVAARDSSIMRAVTKIKEMDAVNTALRSELESKNADLKEAHTFLEDANRKGELAKLVARQYREQAEKLKLTEWKLAKAEEMLRGPSATPASPLSLSSLPDLPHTVPAAPASSALPPAESAGAAAVPPVIPPKPNRLSMQLQHPPGDVQEAVTGDKEKPPPVSHGLSSRSVASAAANEILIDQKKPSKVKEKKAPVRSSTMVHRGRHDDLDEIAPIKPPPAPAAEAGIESPKKHGKEKMEKKDRRKDKRRADSVSASPGSKDVLGDDYRTTLAVYKQDKERYQMQQSPPSQIRSPHAVLGIEPPVMRTFEDFAQNACKLRIYIHNGINFPPCSPFIVVRYGKQRRVTKVIIKTGTEKAWDAEPVWDEAMNFSHEQGVSVVSVEGLSKGGATDKALGSVRINLADYSAFSLPRQFLLVSDILAEQEATTELRSLRITLDWIDEEAEDRRRREEMARSRGLTDTVRGSLIKRPAQQSSDALVSPQRTNGGSSSSLNTSAISTLASSEMCDGANAIPPDVAKVVAYLRSALNPDVRVRNASGMTYLQIVCIEEHPVVVEMLLQKGSPVDNLDSAGLTPLHTACSYGRLESVRALLNAGASGALADHAGNTPLHIAALQGHFEVVKLLISLVKSLDLTATDIQGLTPLHKAAFGGNRAVCELLIDRGVPVNAVCNSGNTPLLLAELGGKIDVSDFLLTKGADFACANKAGETILWAALVRGDVKRASYFVKQFNLSLNASVGPFANTLLHKLPMTMEEPQVVPLFTFLIQNGANVHAKNSEEKTPLFHSCYRGYVQCAKLLLYAGASAVAVDKAGNTPLHFASTTDIAKLLVPKGAKANVKNKQGNTPLHAAFAFFRKDAGLIDYLLSKGSGDSLSKNAKGLSPSEVLHTSVTKRLCLPHAMGDDSLPEYGGLLIKGDLKTN